MASARPGSPGSSTRGASGPVGRRCSGAIAHTMPPPAAERLPPRPTGVPGLTIRPGPGTHCNTSFKRRPSSERGTACEAPPLWGRASRPPRRAGVPAQAAGSRSGSAVRIRRGGKDVSDELTLAEVARRVGVRPATLRRWAASGLVPLEDGHWTPAALAHARIVARLRGRGHTIAQIRDASESGRLAFGYLEDLFAGEEQEIPLEDAAEAVRLEPALVERIYHSLGPAMPDPPSVRSEDLRLLEYIAALLESGFPLVAFLQLTRVYGQAVAQIADAGGRPFHLYVHEPLIRDGVPGLEIAEEMQALACELLPLSAPMMEHLHQRFLQHFVEQDVIGHMEADLGEDAALDLGRLRVAIAFADLAGYTRMTEEVGEEEAVGAVERFVEAVEDSLPQEARVIKTIGDEVMIVCSDAGSLTDW